MWQTADMSINRWISQPQKMRRYNALGLNCSCTSRTVIAHHNLQNNQVLLQLKQHEFSESSSKSFLRSYIMYNTYTGFGSIFLLEDRCEREWRKIVPTTLIKLTLELNPVEPQGVQKCTQGLHRKQNTNSGKEEDDYSDDKDDNIVVSAKRAQHSIRTATIGVESIKIECILPPC